MRWAGGTIALIRATPFRHLCIAAFLLGLLTVSDAFVYLALSERGQISQGAFPLLFVLTSAVYLLLAVPVGHVADRTGRFVTFVAGHLALVPLYVVLSGPVIEQVASICGRSSAGTILCRDRRYVDGGRQYHRSRGISHDRFGDPDDGGCPRAVLGSLIFGICWSRFGLQSAMILFSVGLALAIVLVVCLWPRPEQR